MIEFVSSTFFCPSHARVKANCRLTLSRRSSRCRPVRLFNNGKPGNDWNTHEEFFEFTRGRFVHNEHHEMKIRSIRFDMNELALVASKAINASHCINIRKYPDGVYNKAFIFTMNDGREVVGKVPNPNAGIPNLTTASEVATMEYAHRVLKTPTPKVLAWNSDAQSTRVGAEYIIMEKVAGVPLARIWDKIDGVKQSRIIMKLVSYQRAWSKALFSMYGNLYHRGHLEKLASNTAPPAYGEVPGQADFVIGPSCSRFWTDYGRDTIKCDRGPWKSVEDYFEAIIQREIESVRVTDLFYKHPLLVTGPKLYTITRERKQNAIKAFRQIFRYILPTDEALYLPSIWHDDLHDENIYVDPEDPENITGIIDWQSTHIAPLFEHHLRPPFLVFEGVEHSLDEPNLPDVTSLPPDERAIKLKNFFDKTMAVVFNQLASHHMPKVFEAIQFRTTNLRMILHFIHRVTEVADAQLLSEIAHLRDEWDQLPSIQEGGKYAHHKFPLQFTEQDFETIEKDSDDAEQGHAIMSQIAEQMGPLFPDKGVVQHQDYNEVKQILRGARNDIADQLDLNADERLEFNKQWPFDT